VNALTTFFLRAKHWQVFVLVWGAYVIAGVGIVENPSRIPPSSAAAMLLFVVSFAGWLWSMGSFLSVISEPALRLNIHFFRFAVIFAGVCLPTFFAFPLGRKPMLAILVVPIFLFALFCWAYAYYFVSKSLVTVEKGRAVTRKDYEPTFLLFLVGFLGVWVIQPRINRLYASTHA
jgi:hypothetical protein